MATEFEIVKEFGGYRNKADITNIGPGFLVRSSRNVISTDGERISNRKGYTLDGQANATIGGIRSSNDWRNIRGDERHVRSFGNTLQFRNVDSDGVVTWNTLLTDLATKDVSYTTDDWWDTFELIPTMLFVDGGNKIKEWNGGITTFASATSNTITKQGIQTATTIAFVDSNPDTITDSGNGFITAGFKVGQKITITGSVSNDGVFTIASVTAGVITISGDESLAVEAAGASVTLSTEGTWAEQGFYLSGVSNATVKIVDFSGLSTDTVTITVNGVGKAKTEGTDWTAATDNETTAISLASALNAISGIEASATGDTVFIDRSSDTDVINNLVLSDTVNTTKTPDPFPVNGTFDLGGTTHSYSGGVTTGTLTGVSPSPVGASVGDLIFQKVREFDNSDIDKLPTSHSNDVIEILDNQVYIGSLTTRFIYISQQDDFTDFSFANPRIVGEGAKLTLGGNLKGMVPQEGNMYFSAGRDNWYRTTFQLSSTNTAEKLDIEQLKTNPGEGVLSSNSIQKIKNSVVYISNEPALNTLGRLEELETPQTKNLSDPIKIDFDTLDFTEAAIIYFKFNIFIALPREDLVYIYNIEKGWWESPQILPIASWSIIDGELYGHSSQVPETYRMFDGTSENGKAILAIAAFSLMNFGSRTALKHFNEWYTEGYMSRNSNLTTSLLYELQGCQQLIENTILGSDDNIFCQSPNKASLGKTALGKHGLGNGIGIVDETDLPKFRIIHTPTNEDFHEMQVVYSSNDIDFQWEILAFGPAVSKSIKDNVSIKR